DWQQVVATCTEVCFASGVHNFLRNAPTHDIEETVVFHGQLDAPLVPNCLPQLVLVFCCHVRQNGTIACACSLADAIQCIPRCQNLCLATNLVGCFRKHPYHI